MGWRKQALCKCWYICTKPHNIMSQKSLLSAPHILKSWPLHEGTVQNQSWLMNFSIDKVTQYEVRICLSECYYTDCMEGSVR